MKVLMVALWVVALGLLAVVLGRLVGIERRSAPALIMGLLPWVLLPAYPLVMAAALLHQRVLGLAALIVIGAHLVFIAPALHRSQRPCDGTRLRVVTANLLKSNATPEAAGRALLALHPDVLVVPELTRRIERGLQASGLLTELPYPAVRLLRGIDTVGIYSRLPVSDVQILTVPGQEWPQATIEVGGTPVRIIGVHTTAPRAPRLSQQWYDSLKLLDGQLSAATETTIVAGDFNADRGHASFRGLLHGGVRDAHEERGRGLATTWPARHPFLHLDHVLVRDQGPARIAVSEVREVIVPGSDHRAVVADLAISP